MADEVPVSDVLADAMEYLCKLGSNLRTRSESLKQKRVSKGKLKNAHAVQKAANKVLMICELSKKSLENVEVGVRRVLSIVSKAQRNKGGSDISPNRKPLHPSYQYFRHGVHKLRISKQVPVKHYLSAKVKVHRMSMSELTIYPVYYSCKLYKHRKSVTESSGEDHQNIRFGSMGPIEIAPEEDKENYSKTNVELNLNESDQLATKTLTKQDRDHLSPEDVIQSNNKLEKQIHAAEDMGNITSDSTEGKLTRKQTEKNEINASVNNELGNTQCIEESTSGIGSSDKNTTHIDSSNLSPLSKDNDKENHSLALKESNKSESDPQNTEARDIGKGSSDSDSNKTSSKEELSREVESEKSNKYETNDDQEEIDEIVKASNRHKKNKKFKSLKSKSRESDKDVEYGKGKSHESCINKDKHSNSESVPHSELNKTKSPGKANSKQHKPHTKRFKKIAILDDSDSDTPDKDANVLEDTSKRKDNLGTDREINDSVKMGSDVEDRLLALPQTEKDCIRSSIYSDSEDHSQDGKKTKEVQSAKTSDDNEDSNVDTTKPMIKCNSESVPHSELNKTKSPGKANSKEHKPHTKRFNKIAILDDSDSDTPDKDANVLEDTSKKKDNLGTDRETNDSVKMGSDVEDQLLALPRTEKDYIRSSIYSDSEDHSQDGKKTKDVQSAETSDDNEDSNVDTTKPIIKCVSLNKLLKPELVSTDSKDDKKTDSKRRKGHEISKNKENDTNHKRIKEKRVKFREDEDYWEQKRKEVKAFKPKNCTVNINRLPKFTYVFLQTNNIKKITKEGNIVFGVQESDKVDSGLVENIKHALLNDSDSSSEVRRSIDKVQNSPQSVDKVNKSKQALLDDSDPQEADTIDQDLDKTKKCDDAIISCEKTERPISPFKDALQDSSIQSRSQNNSPANNLQSTPPSNKRDKSTTPQSKRKHIMESMHAKKMLLTYSSSSDTEDEQLRSALKEIKDDLLKCSNSSDEESKENIKESFCRKLLQSSSDSDEDILNRLRKKKKNDISNLVESDDENKTTDKLQEKQSSDNADEDSEMTAKHKRESSQEHSSSSSKKVRLG